MEITSDQMMAVLNQRAQNEPYIKEILRATMYEAVLRMQAESQEPQGLSAVPTPEDRGDNTPGNDLSSIPVQPQVD